MLQCHFEPSLCFISLLIFSRNPPDFKVDYYGCFFASCAHLSAAYKNTLDRGLVNKLVDITHKSASPQEAVEHKNNSSFNLKMYLYKISSHLFNSYVNVGK
jgi:hypothetical protein